jgi:hypothetical protein
MASSLSLPHFDVDIAVIGKVPISLSILKGEVFAHR